MVGNKGTGSRDSAGLTLKPCKFRTFCIFREVTTLGENGAEIHRCNPKECPYFQEAAYYSPVCKGCPDAVKQPDCQGCDTYHEAVSSRTTENKEVC